MIGLSPLPLWHHAFTVMAFGIVYWMFVAQAGRVSEPWDAALYWTAYYPASLLVSAVMGAAYRRRHSLTGFGVSLPQILIMLPTTGDNGLFPFGLALVAALSIPAVFAAWLTAQVAARY